MQQKKKKKHQQNASVEQVSRRFSSRFKQQQEMFLVAITGLPTRSDRIWYAALLLKRLMFLYFLQHQRLLADDKAYLRHQLEAMRERCTPHGDVVSFYRSFLLPLFYGCPLPHAYPAINDPFPGTLSRLPGDLFLPHPLECSYPGIMIPDSAFAPIFTFFDEYVWSLDDDPICCAQTITPAVLGSIFEEFVYHKEKGAYYTKDDVTTYISQNTILPYLLEKLTDVYPSALKPSGPFWSLLRACPDRYISAVRIKGLHLPLPADIAGGLSVPTLRSAWNDLPPEEYALPGEIWRDVLARRTHYQALSTWVNSGPDPRVADLLTWNLDAQRLTLDMITSCQDIHLLLALYDCLVATTILDPTSGSGAFLLAALQVLTPLYAACLTQMQALLPAIDLGEMQAYPQDDAVMERIRLLVRQVQTCASRDYFILRTIFAHNLYGVDIMAEAIEICKMRLTLRLLPHIDLSTGLTFLAELQFHLFVGNALVGFTSLPAASRSVTPADVVPPAHSLPLNRLQVELDRALAADYGIMPACDEQSLVACQTYQEYYCAWVKSHQPFHWCLELEQVMCRGGFGVIIGNPPYVAYNAENFPYRLHGFQTVPCANLYPCIVERSAYLLAPRGYHGMILPLAAFATKSMAPFLACFERWFPQSWISFYHFRPSMLFAGDKVANIPTAIFLASASGPVQRFSTHLCKWSVDQRDQLFSGLIYCPVMCSINSNTINHEKQHYYPKFGTPIENAILEKMLSHQRVATFLTRKVHASPDNTMFYRSAGGLYWKVFINFPWPYQTTSNKSCSFKDGYDRDVFVALFNSSLFWWYYTVTFDSFNLKDYMLFGFRFSYPRDPDLIAALCDCCQALMADFRAHALHLTRGTTGSYTVYARQSKAIIDEIDRLLARHYGFTAEELDFIVNYDIKYRMGYH